MELLSPNVHTKASTSCMVVSYSLANLTALSESKKHSTKARQNVMTMRGFLCHWRKLYFVTARIRFSFICAQASFWRHMQMPEP